MSVSYRTTYRGWSSFRVRIKLCGSSEPCREWMNVITFECRTWYTDVLCPTFFWQTDRHERLFIECNAKFYFLTGALTAVCPRHPCTCHGVDLINFAAEFDFLCFAGPVGRISYNMLHGKGTLKNFVNSAAPWNTGFIKTFCESIECLIINQ